MSEEEKNTGISDPSEGENNGEDHSQNGNEHTDEGEVAVAISMKDFERMEEKLASAQEESQKNLDGWQRALADYNNLRRRTEQERELMRNELVGKVITPFLDILDDLELALQNRSKDVNDNAWGEGIELVYRKLLGKLEHQGVKMLEVEGTAFDPHFHEAITHEENEDFESGQIIAVVKPGYVIGDRVLRPAMVRVAA